ncbi:MAG: ribosomal RNA small subunit methyltransferase A [Desulfobacteraceae bacterium]|nr:ribosomal RNA small subunit methyltransferase A [Desulfobacteraceae bacterium]
MTSPSTLMKAWNLKARKSLGQNFLKDSRIAEQIASIAGIQTDDVVVDLGAGLGAMTLAAAKFAGKVIAVETDGNLVPLLRAQILSKGLSRTQLIEQNMLTLEFGQLLKNKEKRLIVVGNLPYNISSQVVVRLIHHRRYIKRAVLMFQKEVADRLCAPPGTKTYGRLSVILQYCANIQPVREICANQFYPQPKVDSSVIKIEFKKDIEQAVYDEKLFERVVQAAFGQRRKTLRNALMAGLQIRNSQAVSDLFVCIGIDPKRRAETLSVSEFVKLTNEIFNMNTG